MINSLEVDSVSKSYRNNIILSDIYLSCKTNEIIGLFGRNGSGKSTLLKIIFGTTKAENKCVRINGIINEYPYKILDGISYLNQDNFIPKYLTVVNLIKLSICKNLIKTFIDDDLIRNNIKKKISDLSGGELKYLSVKIILYNKSKFCLLDEPYSGVSPLIVERINNLIISQSKFKGIIITDHNFESLLKIVNKFYLLKNGICYHLINKEELVKHQYISIDKLK